jgi:RNA polymerase sigma factor (TIGR02999 family)
MNAGTHVNAEQLFPLVYEELRRIASRQMRRECPGRTLQTTALVHEAFLKLSKAQNGGTPFESEEHFLRAATSVMQRILVDHARARKRTKRGGGKRPQSITGCEAELAHIDLPDYLPELDEALQSLAKREPIAAELVQLRYFGGLTNSQAAAAIGISARSADRYWVFARAWLYQALRGPATK